MALFQVSMCSTTLEDTIGRCRSLCASARGDKPALLARAQAQLSHELSGAGCAPCGAQLGHTHHHDSDACERIAPRRRAGATVTQVMSDDIWSVVLSYVPDCSLWTVTLVARSWAAMVERRWGELCRQRWPSFPKLEMAPQNHRRHYLRRIALEALKPPSLSVDTEGEPPLTPRSPSVYVCLDMFYGDENVFSRAVPATAFSRLTECCPSHAQIGETRAFPVSTADYVNVAEFTGLCDDAMDGMVETGKLRAHLSVVDTSTGRTSPLPSLPLDVTHHLTLRRMQSVGSGCTTDELAPVLCGEDVGMRLRPSVLLESLSEGPLPQQRSDGRWSCPRRSESLVDTYTDGACHIPLPSPFATLGAGTALPFPPAAGGASCGDKTRGGAGATREKRVTDVRVHSFWVEVVADAGCSDWAALVGLDDEFVFEDDGFIVNQM